MKYTKENLYKGMKFEYLDCTSHKCTIRIVSIIKETNELYCVSNDLKDNIEWDYFLDIDDFILELNIDNTYKLLS